jgi:hypothetical protein
LSTLKVREENIFDISAEDNFHLILVNMMEAF